MKLADQPSEDCDSEVDVLIGKDFYWSFFTGDVKWEESGPVARKSYMGVIVPLPQTLGSDTDVHLVRSHTLWLDTSSCDDRVTDKRIYDPLLEQVKKFWELEAIGVSTQEKTMHEKFLDTIYPYNSCYEVSLPWKEQHAKNTSNLLRTEFCLRAVCFEIQELCPTVWLVLWQAMSLCKQ